MIIIREVKHSDISEVIKAAKLQVTAKVAQSDSSTLFSLSFEKLVFPSSPVDLIPFFVESFLSELLLTWNPRGWPLCFLPPFSSSLFFVLSCWYYWSSHFTSASVLFKFLMTSLSDMNRDSFVSLSRTPQICFMPSLKDLKP